METTATRKATLLRLNSDLLDRLKAMAKLEHRSLNNFLECKLFDLVRDVPNDRTIAAMREVRSGSLRGSTPVDLTSVESMLKSAGI